LEKKKAQTASCTVRPFHIFGYDKVPESRFSDFIYRKYRTIDHGFYINLYSPFGTNISNRTPSPSAPVSLMVMPVIDRTSRARNSL